MPRRGCAETALRVSQRRLLDAQLLELGDDDLLQRVEDELNENGALEEDATKRTTNFHPTTRLISVTRNGKKTSATIMTMRSGPSIHQEGAIMNGRKSPWATPARLWMISGTSSERGNR